MLLGFKTELNLNNSERSYCEQHAGTARHAWNWGLEYCISKLRVGEKIPSAIDLHKLLVKEVKAKNEWYYDVSKCSPQQALRDLEQAFKRFWKLGHKNNANKPFKDRYHKRYIKQKAKGKIDNLTFEHEKGFPSYKKKGINDKFYLEGNIIIENRKIKLPKFGWVKIYEKGIVGKAKNVTITRRADDWFISYKVENEPINVANRKPVVGVDIGIKTLASCSDGVTFDNPKAYQCNKKRLAREQRKLSRQYENCRKNKDANGHNIKSNNYKKTQKKIAKLHLRISNIRKDATHKLTSYLVKSHDQIVIEDLNVSGMMKNHKIAGAISDGGFYEFRRQLEYKGEIYNCAITIADRWFASSKTCSCCGHKQDMPLRKRIFACEKCANILDRDMNAAINLKNYAVSFTVNACSLNSKVHCESKVGVGAGTRLQG